MANTQVTKYEQAEEVDEIVQFAGDNQQQRRSLDEQRRLTNGSTNATASTNNNTNTSEDDFMDYDTDDDDDDLKSNHSSSNQNINPNALNASGKLSLCKNKGQSSKDEDKRAHHNVLERRRRDHLKDSFTQLRDAVPSFRSERASRTEILVQAADFIISRVQKNAMMQRELDSLIRENARLDELNKNRQSLQQGANIDQPDHSIKKEDNQV